MEFGNIDSQTPANKEAVNSGNCLPVNLDIKGNNLDHTAIQTLKEKNGLADLSLNPVMVNASGIIQKHGGMFLSMVEAAENRAKDLQIKMAHFNDEKKRIKDEISGGFLCMNIKEERTQSLEKEKNAFQQGIWHRIPLYFSCFE